MSKARKRRPLTLKEREAVTWLLVGYTNKEIAERSGISIHGVRQRLYGVFRKFKLTSRYEAIRFFSGKDLDKL